MKPKTWLLVLFFFVLLLAALLAADAAWAAEVVYYCRGAEPFGGGEVNRILDYTVWIERQCAWLPMVIH